MRLSCAPATLLGEAQQTAWNSSAKAPRRGSRLLRRGELGPHRIVAPVARVALRVRTRRWTSASTRSRSSLRCSAGPERRAYGATSRPSGRGGTASRSPSRRRTSRSPSSSSSQASSCGSPRRSGSAREAARHRVPRPGRVALSRDLGGVRLAARALDERRVLHRGAAPPRAVSGIDWARALVELGEAIDEDRPHRAGAEHAAHVVEALNAIEESSESGGTVTVLELSGAGARRLGDVSEGGRARPPALSGVVPTLRPAAQVAAAGRTPDSMRSSSSSVPWRTGPLNHLWAESTYQPPKSRSAPPTVIGA